MNTMYRIVRNEETGKFALMEILTERVIIDGLDRTALMAIMESCSKWIDELEASNVE